jgi:hypothetical protein
MSLPHTLPNSSPGSLPPQPALHSNRRPSPTQCAQTIDSKQPPARQPSKQAPIAPSCIAASVGDTGAAEPRHDRALAGDTLESSMEQISSPRWPIREQRDVENTSSYGDECDGGIEV